MTLSEDDLRLIRACLYGIAVGPFIPDWEFETLTGVTRAECAAIAANWSPSDLRREKVRLAVANAINQLIGYPIDHEDQWARYIPVTRDALKGLRDRFARASLPPK